MAACDRNPARAYIPSSQIVYEQSRRKALRPAVVEAGAGPYRVARIRMALSEWRDDGGVGARRRGGRVSRLFVHPQWSGLGFWGRQGEPPLYGADR